MAFPKSEQELNQQPKNKLNNLNSTNKQPFLN